MSGQRNLALVAPLGTPQVTPTHALSPGAQPLPSLMIQPPARDSIIPATDTGVQYLTQGPQGPIPISQSIDPSLTFMPGTGAHEAYQANLQRAADVALAFGPGIIGGMRAGVRLPPGEADSPLVTAWKMEAGEWPHNAPLSRDEIFDRTGWFRGGDDKWRFIIPDEGARLKTENLRSSDYTNYKGETFKLYSPEFGGMKLGDVLDHPNFYEAYPWMRDIEVRHTPLGAMMSINGAFDKANNRIYLTGGKEDETLSTLLHEAQHAIQYHEGFARGGNTAEFLLSTHDEEMRNVRDDKEGLEKQISNAGAEPINVAGVHGFYPFDTPIKHMTEKAKSSVDGLPQYLIDSYKDVQTRYGNLMNQRSAATKNYLNLGGEIEARSVQAMLHEHQWSRPPWEVPMGYDFRGNPIPYPEQTEHIIKFNEPGPGGSAGVVLTPVGHDPFAIPPGAQHGEVVPFGRGAEIRGEQQAAEEAKKREQVGQRFEEMRSGLLPQPSYPMPREVTSALNYFDRLGFDTNREAIGALRQSKESGADWRKAFDLRPTSEFMPDIDELGAKRDQALHRTHMGNLEKYLSLPPGTWTREPE